LVENIDGILKILKNIENIALSKNPNPVIVGKHNYNSQE